MHKAMFTYCWMLLYMQHMTVQVRTAVSIAEPRGRLRDKTRHAVRQADG